MHLHMRDTLVILEERNRHHPLCPACDMLVPWADLNRRHPEMDIYERGSERNIRRLAEEEAQSGEVTEFRDYDRPPEIVSSFKYLGRLLTATDYNWTAVISNIQKTSRSWYCLDQILGREGAYNWTLGRFYVVFVQAILLFG